MSITRCWSIPEKYHLIACLMALLMFGFLISVIVGYIIATSLVRDNVLEHTLPLTGDNIYSEVQKDMLRPVFIASMMSQDTFLRDWALRGEEEMEPVTH